MISLLEEMADCLPKIKYNPSVEEMIEDIVSNPKVKRLFRQGGAKEWSIEWVSDPNCPAIESTDPDLKVLHTILPKK